ncbi:MAG: hypothetical protein U0Q10_13155 [Dermatophilaceae bacterium]
MREVIVGAYASTLSDVFRYAMPSAFIALAVGLVLKTVPLTDRSAAAVGPGFGVPDARTSAEQLEARLVSGARLLTDQWLKSLGRDPGVDAMRRWVVWAVAQGQRAAGGFAPMADNAITLQVPLRVLETAVADAASDGLVESHPEGLVLTQKGFGVFREIVGSGFRQLRDAIEAENQSPLTDQDEAELRVIARRLILGGRPFTPRAVAAG